MINVNCDLGTSYWSSSRNLACPINPLSLFPSYTHIWIFMDRNHIIITKNYIEEFKSQRQDRVRVLKNMNEQCKVYASTFSIVYSLSSLLIPNLGLIWHVNLISFPAEEIIFTLWK